jgi:hypothetical protein
MPNDGNDENNSGAKMRQALLAKVPVLEYRGASVLEALKLDADSDLRGTIEVDVEAFLTPLEITTRRRG